MAKVWDPYQITVSRFGRELSMEVSAASVERWLAEAGAPDGVTGALRALIRRLTKDDDVRLKTMVGQEKLSQASRDASVSWNADAVLLKQEGRKPTYQGDPHGLTLTTQQKTRDDESRDDSG